MFCNRKSVRLCVYVIMQFCYYIALQLHNRKLARLYNYTNMQFSGIAVT